MSSSLIMIKKKARGRQRLRLADNGSPRAEAVAMNKARHKTAILHSVVHGKTLVHPGVMCRYNKPSYSYNHSYKKYKSLSKTLYKSTTTTNTRQQQPSHNNHTLLTLTSGNTHNKHSGEVAMTSSEEAVTSALTCSEDTSHYEHHNSVDYMHTPDTAQTVDNMETTVLMSTTTSTTDHSDEEDTTDNHNLYSDSLKMILDRLATIEFKLSSMDTLRDSVCGDSSATMDMKSATLDIVNQDTEDLKQQLLETRYELKSIKTKMFRIDNFCKMEECFSFG